MTTYRFNPPPGWPLPAGFVPQQGWAPEPGWPPAPEGWQFWLPADPPLPQGPMAPMPGASMPMAPMPMAPMPGAPMPGAPMPGAPMPMAPMPGAPMPGAMPMRGGPTQPGPLGGTPEERAYAHQLQMLSQAKAAAARQMRNGAIALAVGLVITVGGFLWAAERGGSYFVFYGPVLFGLVSFVRGLVNWLRPERSLRAYGQRGNGW